MKRSVNGKFFDEIFSERGDELKFYDLLPNDLYLFTRKDTKTMWVAKIHHCVYSIIKKVLIIEGVENNCGFFVSFRSPYNPFFHNVRKCRYFEATKNQIDLLNSYINDFKNNKS